MPVSLVYIKRDDRKSLTNGVQYSVSQPYSPPLPHSRLLLLFFLLRVYAEIHIYDVLYVIYLGLYLPLLQP